MEMNAYECMEVRGECFTTLHLIPMRQSLNEYGAMHAVSKKASVMILLSQ